MLPTGHACACTHTWLGRVDSKNGLEHFIWRDGTEDLDANALVQYRVTVYTSDIRCAGLTLVYTITVHTSGIRCAGLTVYTITVHTSGIRCRHCSGRGHQRLYTCTQAIHRGQPWGTLRCAQTSRGGPCHSSCHGDEPGCQPVHNRCIIIFPQMARVLVAYTACVCSQHTHSALVLMLTQHASVPTPRASMIICPEPPQGRGHRCQRVHRAVWH